MSGQQSGPGINLNDSGLARIGKQAITGVASRLLRKLLMKILAWVGSLLAVILPIIVALAAAMLIVGVIAGAFSSGTDWEQDPILAAAWPKSMQERAQAISDASVNPEYEDEQEYKTPPALLAAFRMMMPGLETEKFQIDVIGEKLKPQITRIVLPTKKVTTTKRRICDELEGCHTVTSTHTEEGEMSLIEKVVAWDGIHHFTYKQVTDTDTEKHGDTTTTVVYTYWEVDREWKDPNKDLIKAALVAHDPPLASYDKPEELEAQANAIISLMRNQDNPLTSAAWFSDGIIAGALPPTHVYDGEPLVGEWIWPMNGPRIVTSLYGWRIHPVYGTRKWHSGVDMWSADPNIRAVADGVVVEAGYVSGYGNRIVLDHGNGVKTTYNHMQSLIHEVGDVLERGQVVGYEGNTGVGTGPHLHFEVIVKDGTANPLEVMFPGVDYICSNCGGGV